jgi:integrase
MSRSDRCGPIRSECGARRFRRANVTGSHRALRQVLQAAVRWKWIEENVATLVKNPERRAGEIHPFDSWEEIDAIAAELGDTDGPLVVFMAGTGVRPEEAFAGDWRDVDLAQRVFRVRRAFAKGRLKESGKTTGSRRAVPLRTRVVEALEGLQGRRGLLFPAPAGGRIDINDWRWRQWTHLLAGADEYERELLDRFDNGRSEPDGRCVGGEEAADAA